MKKLSASRPTLLALTILLVTFVSLTGWRAQARRQAFAALNHHPVASATHAASPVRESIARKLKTQTKVTVELFVMSQCPFGVQAEEAMAPVLKEFGDQVDFQLRFIAEPTGDGFTSMHGQPEVDEDLRQAVMAAQYPQQFFDYVVARASDYRNAEWQPAAAAAGMEAATVEQLTRSATGRQLFAENIRRANELNITASPTILLDGEKYTGKILPALAAAKTYGTKSAPVAPSAVKSAAAMTCTQASDCNDNNACTEDGCDSGKCTNILKNCDDNNACTVDTCDPVIGCTNTQLICDDSNACTRDTCDPMLGCVYAPISCDDNNPNTIDSCDRTRGCVNTPTCDQVVTNTNDSGFGSLRAAIAQACSGGTITFSNSTAGGATNFFDGSAHTITLTSGELFISKNLTIQGPGANVLTISGNQASRVFNINRGVIVTLDRLTVANGKARVGGGGISNSGTLTFTNSTISGNSAGTGGGILSGGTLTLTNCTLSGNSAANSVGGIYNTGGTVTLTNSTLSGNTTIGPGGGILSNGTLTLTNSTLSGNSASQGGGIYHAGGTVNARNTLIAGNVASSNADIYGTLTSLGYNLIGNSNNSTITAATGDQIGTHTNPINPLLSTFDNYGGPTQTLRPLPGSPAINAGNNCVLTANGCGTNDPPTALNTDQRGFNRQIGSTVDIGAVEVDYALAATSGTPQSAAVLTAFVNPLVATLTESNLPVSGVPLTFTAPLSGASTSFTSPNPATTNVSGQGSVTATANATTGSYFVTVGANGLTPASFSLANTCQTITFSPTSLAAAPAGTAYSQALTVTPTGSYTFSIILGSLPSGLTLNPTTGLISGLPSGTGTFNFTVKALAPNGCSATQAYTLVLNCPTITLPGSITNPTINTAYSQTVSASPAGSYSYAVTAGALPAGLTLNAATGVISGTPTTGGAYSFTIRATRFSTCTGSQTYSGTISCPTITLACPSCSSPGILPDGKVNTLYARSLAATPSATYTYSITAGALPPGLSLIGASLSGRPTTAGTYNFTVRAQGSGGCFGTQAYTLTVTPATLASKPNQTEFDGDGKSDLWSYRATDGRWLIQRSSDNTIAFVRLGSVNEVAVPADYDGDGQTDAAVFNAAKSRWQILQSSDGSMREERFGTSEGQAFAADFDGDGKADLAVKSTNGEWQIKPSSDGEIIQFVLGETSDQPVIGDFNGDGWADVAAYRANAGLALIRHSGDGSMQEMQLAFATGAVMAADFDGDGADEFALWSAEKGLLQFRRSSDQQEQQLTIKGQSLLLGDFDGDGLSDCASWLAAGWQWRLSSRDWLNP